MKIYLGEMRELRKSKEELNENLIMQLEETGSFPNIRAEVKQFLIQVLCEDIIDCTSPSNGR